MSRAPYPSRVRCSDLTDGDPPGLVLGRLLAKEALRCKQQKHNSDDNYRQGQLRRSNWKVFSRENPESKRHEHPTCNERPYFPRCEILNSPLIRLKYFHSSPRKRRLMVELGGARRRTNLALYLARVRSSEVLAAMSRSSQPGRPFESCEPTSHHA